MKIHKNVIALGWVSFFTDMASSMITTLLPIYIVYTLHEGVDKLGVVIAIATFISYLFRILFGYISDKYRIIKPFVVVGYFLSAITKPLIGFTHSYMGVASIRAVERMGKAIRSAPKDLLISENVIKDSHARTFGFHKMMDIAGELSGAIIIFLVLYFVTYDEEIMRTIFKITIIPGLIATAIAIFFVHEQEIKVKVPKQQSVFSREDYKLIPVLSLYFLVIFFLMSEQFFILKAKTDGFSMAMIPLFIIVLTFVQTASSYYSGVLIESIGTKKALLLAFVFAFISVAVVSINLWLAFAFLGLFTVVSLNTIRAFISEHAFSKGFIFGVFYAGIAVFGSLGALVIGNLWEHYGVEKVLEFSEIGILSSVTLLLLSLFLQKSD